MVTTELAEHLSDRERRSLAVLEETIERNLQGFMELGTALLHIRDERLYREGHKTFERYCQARWQFGRRRANKLIEAAAAATALNPPDSADEDLGQIWPKLENESQAAELAKAKPAARPLVWQRAVELAPKDDAGKAKVTAVHVRLAVREDAERHRLPASAAPKAKAPAPSASPSPQETGSAPEAAADPTHPWAAYNADCLSAAGSFRSALATIGRMTEAHGGTFGAWVVLKDWKRLCADAAAVMEGHAVTGWAPQRADLPGGRNFYYAEEAPKARRDRKGVA